MGVRPILPETEALEEEGDSICLEVDMVTRNHEYLILMMGHLAPHIDFHVGDTRTSQLMI